jgi:hypothetical protein
MLQPKIHLLISIENHQSLRLPYWARELEEEGYQSQKRGRSVHYQTLQVTVEPRLVGMAFSS